MNRRKLDSYRKVFLWAAIIFGVMADEASAQWHSYCQNGQWISLGPGKFQCVPNQRPAVPQPAPQLPSIIEPSKPSIAADIFDALSNLTQQLSGSIIALSGYGPLSSNLNSQQSPQVNVSPPPGFFDPYANSTPSQQTPPQPGVNPFTGKTATGLHSAGPTAPPGQTAPSQSGPPGTYADCVGASTFGQPNPAYCEMGGYVYFRNGQIMKE